ncbi:predicted protein [Uncinocarpus reesii 1704]|uniref:DOMON domain-containing protein n=1 Tax=Uncinocarpus reesii (strain UAMH 1704) TaxID=336963 RepID=C4JN17_UNCRE|nr:uncharacterized protein UREG_04225 [Uncinocarpus reesii 1704]EEP79379.1 predicted protein [Uncinocarpus reesii 1704]
MRFSRWIEQLAAFSLIACVSARPAAFHPQGREDITFSVAVSYARKSTTPDALLFQIKAPTTVRWVALGQGNQMAGANMFLVYSSSSPSNVTVSPRSAPGHAPPKFNPNAQISLLSGSGIRDGFMTANIRCEACLVFGGGLWDEQSIASEWIWAYTVGRPMSSDDLSTDIDFHDDFGGAVIDLSRTKADSSDKDPFLNPIWDAVRGSEGSDNPPAAIISTAAIAHGCLMAIAFVVLMPIFAMLVPISTFVPISVTRVHAPLQGMALVIAITGLGLGVKLWTGAGARAAIHPILGIIVVVCLCLLQPSFGWLQHKHFVRTGGRSPFASLHRWLGRIMIALGIINGGVGLLWAGAGVVSGPLHTGLRVYVVLAGMVFLGYTIAHVGISVRTGRQRGACSLHSSASNEDLIWSHEGRLNGGGGASAKYGSTD